MKLFLWRLYSMWGSSIVYERHCIWETKVCTTSRCTAWGCCDMQARSRIFTDKYDKTKPTIGWWSFWRRYSRKNFLLFVLSDLDLWPFDLKFVPLVTLVQRYGSTKLEIFTAFLFRGRSHDNATGSKRCSFNWNENRRVHFDGRAHLIVTALAWKWLMISHVPAVSN